jgi:hypothetical protein
MQSMAINLYLAKKASLLGDNDADFAKSSMMLAESLVRFIKHTHEPCSFERRLLQAY